MTWLVRAAGGRGICEGSIRELDRLLGLFKERVGESPANDAPESDLLPIDCNC